jgi:hypothetical protein
LPGNDEDQLPDAERRRFLGGVAVLARVALGGLIGEDGAQAGEAQGGQRPESSGGELDRALREQVKTIVVIYAENRSFNNLFADFPGVQKPLSALNRPSTSSATATAACWRSCRRWGGVLPLGQSLEGVTYAEGVQYQAICPMRPSRSRARRAKTCR